MLYYIASFILKIAGWRLQGKIPTDIKKCIIIQAPHTSYYDFYIGWLASKVLRVKFSFMIKKEAFKPITGSLLKACGGVPVDRGKSQRTVKHLVNTFKQSKEMYLIITPEGTRKLVHNWKKGYYTIAMAAEIPILLGFLDYKHKICGIGEDVLYPSGNYEADFKTIETFYKGRHAKYPENFNLS